MPSEHEEKMEPKPQEPKPMAELLDPRTSLIQTQATIGFEQPPVAEEGPPYRVGTFKDIEKKSASNIALIITWTFSGSAALLLIGLYFILLRNPADAKLLLDAAVPALKETGTFLSTVFGPLLGFVLGYYFRDRKDRD